jgi:hypothetical protein
LPVDGIVAEPVEELLDELACGAAGTVKAPEVALAVPVVVATVTAQLAC